MIQQDLSAYRALIERKRVSTPDEGLLAIPALNDRMFDHQRHATEFALRRGRAALFLDTGLGKSLAALDWGRVVVEHTNKPVLMLAPLAVAAQHEREAAAFGIDAMAVRSADEMGARRVYITNYDRLDKFDPDRFGGVILDESSIIKSFNGKTTKRLINAFAKTRFRLACTATPAPNDHTELGTHAEFLGVMRREEMLPIWFINDTADTGTWRIKGHAQENFWQWVASWSRCISNSRIAIGRASAISRSGKLPKRPECLRIAEALNGVALAMALGGKDKLQRHPEYPHA